MDSQFAIDPELTAFVNALPQRPSSTPAESRAIAREFTSKFAAHHDSNRDGLEISDRRIPGPDGAREIDVRIYEPASRTDAKPCLVYFHGGGWIAGDLDSEDSRCARFAAQADCVVVSVDYRLAPENRFPAPVDDCYAALEWTTARASELRLEPQRIGIGGVSAGGNLAAAVALMARDRRGPSIAFQLLVVPALDDRMQTASMRFVGTPLVDGRASARAWSYYLGEDRTAVSPYAAPARAVDLRRLPPAFIATAEFDPLRDEGIAYALRLLEDGVSVELHNYAGTFHGFDAFPSSISTRATSDQVDWLRRNAHRRLDEPITST